MNNYNFQLFQRQYSEEGFQEEECQFAQLQKQIDDLRITKNLQELDKFYSENNISESTQFQDQTFVDQSKSENNQGLLSESKSYQSCCDYPQSNNQDMEEEIYLEQICDQSEGLVTCLNTNLCPQTQVQVGQNNYNFQNQTQQAQHCYDHLQQNNQNQEFETQQEQCCGQYQEQYICLNANVSPSIQQKLEANNQITGSLINPIVNCSNNQHNPTTMNISSNNLCLKKLSPAKQKAIKKNKNAYCDAYTCKECQTAYASHAGITNHVKTNHLGKETWELQVKPNRKLGRPKSKKNAQSFQK